MLRSIGVMALLSLETLGAQSVPWHSSARNTTLGAGTEISRLPRGYGWEPGAKGEVLCELPAQEPSDWPRQFGLPTAWASSDSRIHVAGLRHGFVAGSQNGEIAVWRDGSWQEPVALSKEPVVALLSDGDLGIWSFHARRDRSLVFYSSDGGSSWQAQADLAGETVRSAVRQGGRLYVLTEAGVWTSGDGYTWEREIVDPDETGFPEELRACGEDRLTLSSTASASIFTVVVLPGACGTFEVGGIPVAPLAFGGGSFQFTVRTSSSCSYSVRSNQPYLRGGGTFRGNQTISLTMDANPGPERSATLTVGSRTYSIRQAARPLVAAPCSVRPASTNIDLLAPWTTFDLWVEAGSANCAWQVGAVRTAAPDGWLRPTVAGGIGSGWLRFLVTPFPLGMRMAKVTVAGRDVEFVQRTTFPANTGCASVQLGFANNVPLTGGTFTIDVGSSNGCRWTLESGSEWIRPVTINEGYANGKVTFRVDPSANARVGRLYIPFTLVQRTITQR